MWKKLLLPIWVLIQVTNVASGSEKHGIGMGFGMVYLSDDNKFDPGLHLGYSYGFQKGKSPLSAGGAMEVIFGDERHIGMSLQLGYTPAEGWDVGAGPGVMLEGDTHYFCIHVASSFGFDLGKFSIGPALELAHTGKHYHVLTGIHIETGF